MSRIIRAYAETPYGQLHYRWAGEGFPLLLLHQTASCSETYEPVIPYLAPHYRVLAVDTPGFGMSDGPPHQYTVADYARCIAAFLDALQVERASVFGHHTGAALGCELAAGYPHRVDTLILYGIPYWAGPAEEVAKRFLSITLKGDGSHLLDVWQDIVGRVRGAFPQPYTGNVLDLLHRETLWKLMAGERYKEAYIALVHYDIMNRLPLIQAPTLLIAGENDSLVHNVEPAAARIQRVRTCKLPGGTYFLTREDPEGLARVVLDFLAAPGV
ncbi:MAG: alpha/beta hydrolase [Candidatus Rokubacteria bacterium]|nr:alpha/beta hydrolase [Candidatus Rokubacteria bacterium]